MSIGTSSKTRAKKIHSLAAAMRPAMELLENRVLFAHAAAVVVATPAVTSLTLINADTDLPIAGYDPLLTGTTLDLYKLPTHDLNIRVNTSAVAVGSVGFNYDGKTTYFTDSVAPFDIGGDTTGNYLPWTPALGAHTLIVTPYTGTNRTGTAGTALSENFTVINSAPSTPYTGTAYVLPGQIEAENFDNGGETVAYHDTTPGNQGGAYRTTSDVDIEACTDTGGGYNIGHIQAGEWLNYTVNVTTAGSYSIGVRVASAVSGGSFHVAIDGTNVTGAMSMPNTGGWQTWTTVTASNINLTAGQHLMKLMFDSSTAYEMGNVNYILVSAMPTETPFLGSALALPGTIQLDNFDNGGEGIAYHDTTAANLGGGYRSGGVDIEATTDVIPTAETASSPGAGFNIGHIQSGEWMNFTVNVAATGSYAIDARVASAVSGGSFHFEIDGANVTGSMALPNTGGWQSWSTVSSGSLNVTAGQHVLRLVIEGNLTYDIGNMNWMDLRSTTATPPLNWTTITPSPVAREEGESLVIGNLIYAFGGFDDPAFDCTNRADVYNMSTDTWTQLADMPETINHAGMIYDSAANNIWVIGGYTGDEDEPGINQVWEYSLTNNTWAAGPSLPSGVGAPDVALIGRNIHVIDGLTETPAGVEVNTTEHWVMSLDNQQAGWTNAAAMPTPRNHSACVTVNGLIYVIGGQNATDEYSGNIAEVDAYNPATDTWTTVASLPEGRSHTMNSTVVYNGKILVIGGEINGTPFSPDVLEYDPTANTWTKLSYATLPQGRKSPIAGVFGNQLVVFGGQNPNPNSDGWTATLP
jgi:N-acetylneuraminic acid mutarotase